MYPESSVPGVAASPAGVGMQTVLGSAWLLLCATAWIVGGGPGGVADRWLAIPAVLLLHVALLARWPGKPTVPWGLWFGVPLTLLILPLLQCLPLPLSLWAAFPGRAPIAAALATAGVTVAHPAWSVSPQRTEAALWALCVPISVYVCALMLSPAWRRRGLIVALGVGVANVVLSLAQLQDGGDALLYPYGTTNIGSAVGLYANRNHLASALVAVLPMATALWLRSATGDTPRPRRWLRRGLLVLSMIFVAVGVTATQSRTGFALLMVVLVACGGWAWAQTAGRGTASTRGLQAALGITLLLVLQYTLLGVYLRLTADPLDDLRWLFARQALHVASLTRGLGWGIGSFPHAYDLLGAAAADQTFYVNHVHNDYVELWLEGGIVAAILIGLAVVWMAVHAVAAWRQRHRNEVPDVTLSIGASLSLLCLLLHSVVDYPLRTTAIEAYAGLLLALLVAPRLATVLPAATAAPPMPSGVPNPLPEAANDPVSRTVERARSAPEWVSTVPHSPITPLTSRKKAHDESC